FEPLSAQVSKASGAIFEPEPPGTLTRSPAANVGSHLFFGKFSASTICSVATAEWPGASFTTPAFLPLIWVAGAPIRLPFRPTALTFGKPETVQVLPERLVNSIR